MTYYVIKSLHTNLKRQNLSDLLKSNHTNFNTESFHNFTIYMLRLVESYKSFQWRCYIKKAFLQHFVIFTGKHLRWGLFFNKVAGHQCCNFIKKKLQRRYFLVNIEKFIITPILQNICERLHFWEVFCKNIVQIRTQKRELLMKQEW